MMKQTLGRLGVLAGTVVLAVAVAGCSSNARKGRHLRKAGEHFERQDYSQAIIEYMNVLKLDPNNPDAIQRLGLSFYRTGDIARGFPLLKAADKLTPDVTDVQLALGSIYLVGRRFREAHALASLVLEREPRNTEAVVLLGDSSIEPEQLDQAQEILDGLATTLGDQARYHMIRGSVLLRRQKPEAAGAAYRKAVELAPDKPYVHMALGFFHKVQGDPENARLEYQTAAELAPLASPSRIAWAVYEKEAGRTDEARRILEEITRKEEGYLPAWFELAKLALAENKPDEALPILQRILEKRPDHFEARRLLARARLTKGETAAAIEEYERLTTQYPNSPTLLCDVARAYLRHGEMQKALTALRTTMELKPDFTEAGLLLASLELRAGHISATVDYLETLLETQPDHERAQILLGAAYRAQGRPEQAETLYRRLIELKPNTPQPCYLLGLSLKEQGRKSEAEAALLQALARDPGFLQALAELIAMDMAADRPEAALARIAEHAAAAPDTQGLPYLRGRVLGALGKTREAEAAFQEAIDTDPQFPGSYLALSHLYAQEGRDNEAMAKLQESLAMRPDDPATLMLAATIHQRQGHFDDARKLYEQILRIDPKFVGAINNLAYLYASRFGETDKAYELATRARELAPGDAYVADTLGWILYLRGEHKWARDLLKESADRLPAMPDVLYHAGMAHYAFGEEQAAAGCLRRALASGSDFPGAADAKELLAVLSIAADGVLEGDALTTVQENLEREPGHAAALVRIGAARERDSDPDGAEEAYAAALVAYPNYLPALLALARRLSDQPGETERALELAKQARDLANGDPQVGAALGWIAYQAGDHAWAHGLLAESATRRPDDAIVQYHLGLTSYRLGQVEDAAARVQQALTLGLPATESGAARHFLAMVALPTTEEAADQAIARIENALETDDDDLPALVALGAIRKRRGDAEGAIAVYEGILRDHPDFAPAARDLASLYASVPGRQAEAFDLAMKARRSLPEDAEAANVLAQIAYARGDYKWAVQLLEESADRGGETPQSVYCLGMSYSQTGDTTNAVRVLRRALELGPDSPHAAEARRLLTEMQ